MSHKSAVDTLKDKLYSRRTQSGVNTDVRTPLSSAPVERAGRSWHEDVVSVEPEMVTEQQPPFMATHATSKHHSWAARFLWGSLLFFILACGAALYTFFGGGNAISPARIELEIVAPSLIDSGKKTNLQYVISNLNGIPLKNVDLVIDYPDGTRSVEDVAQPLLHERKTVGTVESNTQNKQTSSAIFYGPEGSQQTLRATLEYQIPNSNSIFTREATMTLTVGSAPVSIEVSAPSEAVAGQSFSMDVTVKSNAATEVADAALHMQAPFGFVLTGSDPAASAGGTLFKLGSLEVGTAKTIHLTGTLDGQDGDARVFHFIVGSLQTDTDTQIKVPLLTLAQPFTVRKPFISATIALDGKTGTVAEPLGKTVQGTIDWTNNLPDAVSNLTLTLTLAGAALDPSSVAVQGGFYNSSDSSIVWSGSQNTDLVSVGPGRGGTLHFSFSTLLNSFITNPNVTLNLTVHAARTGQGGVQEDVTTAASARVTLASAISLAASLGHFTGPFTNTGPMPPVANQQTTYTITWAIKNSSNSVTGTTVSAVLPPNVDFIAAQPSNAVSFDSGSRIVTWNVGDLSPGVGYSSAARTASFQVRLTPSVSQVGDLAPVVGASTVTALDRFAGANIKGTASALNTRSITSEQGFTSAMGVVQSAQ